MPSRKDWALANAGIPIVLGGMSETRRRGQRLALKHRKGQLSLPLLLSLIVNQLVCVTASWTTRTIGLSVAT